MARREGRLRPEFEAWYPSLRSGEWYSADQLTATVLEQLRSGAPQWHYEDRVPDEWQHYIERNAAYFRDKAA